MTQNLFIRRREVLVSLAAAAVPASAAEPLDVNVTATGFTVNRDGIPVWAVPSQTLRNAFGEEVTVELVSGVANKLLLVNGRLLDRPTLLRIAFEERNTSWFVNATLTIGSGPLISFIPAPVPSTAEASFELGRALTAAMARPLAAILPAETRLAGARLWLRRDLSTHLDLPNAGEVWLGVPRVTQWRLLPGIAGDGDVTTLARAELPTSMPFDVEIGRRAERTVRLTGRTSTVRAIRSPILQSGLVVEGTELRLSVGSFGLRLADAAGGPERAAFGLDSSGSKAAEIVLRVAVRDQRVSAPGGNFIVTGTRDGPADVRLSARAGAVTKFDVSAALTHYDIRLPLGDGVPGYADQGRLDFTNYPRLAFWLGAGSDAGMAGIARLSGSGPAVELSLDQARLRVRRERDLLSLVFGFDGVGLVVGDRGAMLRLPSGVGACPTGSVRSPLLRVEFPPQHVLEHAYARRRPQVPTPEISADAQDGKPSEAARARLPGERAALDKELRDSGRYTKEFEDFLVRYRERLKALLIGSTESHPDYYWFGADFAFTPQARRAAREVVTVPRPSLSQLTLGVPRIVVADLVATYPPTDEAGASALLQALLLEAERRDDDHALVQAAWRTRRAADVGRAGMPAQFFDKSAWGAPSASGATPWEAEFSDPAIATSIRTMWAATRDFPDPGASAAVASALHAAYAEPFPWCGQNQGDCVPHQPPNTILPVEARAAGVTHLVFEWPCSQGSAATGVSERNYTLADLLKWDDLQLRVTRRAQRFEPRSPFELAFALRHQEISAGDNPRARLAEVTAAAARNGEPPQVEDWASTEPATWRDSPKHTRITLPARMHLSPAADARFRTSPTPSADGPVPLWRAELREQPGQPPTLRAIGSPDFVAAALGAGAPTPDRGPSASWTRSAGGARFRGSLDAYDRHQIVGLSSVHGLPVIPRRGPDGKLHLSQVAPPPAYRLKDLQPNDVRDQALYIPQALSTRHLSLSAMGATLDLDARFTPPAALRDALGRNLFEAFSVERWRSHVVLGREVVTEVLYKGFLYPLGHKATLVKVTERRFEPPPEGVPGGPVAYLSQRLFIQVAAATKTYRALGQPFEGRAWPARSVEILTLQTPDLIEPFISSSADNDEYEEKPRGTLRRKGGIGLVFWPRTALGKENDVRFRLRVDRSSDVLDLPLLFVDNAAAHEPVEMRRVQDYYNGTYDKALKSHDSRRRLSHRGAARRYALERRPGDTVFETRAWVLRADSRAGEIEPGDAPHPWDDVAIRRDHAMDSALESDDQPPFYPRLHESLLRHGPAARFSGSDPGELTVRYAADYLRDGFTTLSEEEARKGGGLRNDTFLHVIAPVSASMTFGEAGDRGGAIGRPEQQIKGVARVGPVGALPDSGAGGLPQKFFGNGAKLLGLISFEELLEKVATNAAAPLLREVTEFTCSNEVQNGFGALGDMLHTFHGAISGNVVASEVYGNLLNLVGEARDKVRAVAACDAGDSTGLVSAVTSATLALRTLSAELERLAAAPLAPLSEFARERLERERQEIASKLETASKEMLAATGIGEQIKLALNRARDLLLPVREAWLRAAFVASEAERALLNGVHQKIAKALDDSFEEAIKGMPPTLPDLRTKTADEVRTRLLTLAEEEGGAVEPILRRFAAATRNTINGMAIPPAVAGIYALAVALARADFPEVVRRLRAEVGQHLSQWAAGVAPAVCEKATAVLIPLRTLIESLGDGLGVCSTHDRSCAAPEAAPGGQWCTDLWVATCGLGNEVAGKTDQLVIAFRDFGDAKNGLAAAIPSEPNCVPGLPVAEWDRVVATWRNLATAANEWFDELIKRANELRTEVETRARDEALEHVKAVVDVARRMLAALVLPSTSVDAIQTALEVLVGSVEAKNAVEPLRTASTKLTAALSKLSNDPADAGAALQAARKALSDLPKTLEGIGTKILERIFFLHVAPAVKEWLEGVARPLLKAAAKAYDAFADARDIVATNLAAADQRLGATGDARLACTVFLGLPPGAACETGALDGLRAEAMRFEEASKGAAPATAFLTVLREWDSRRAAPQRILDNLLRNLAGAAVAQIVQLLDIGDLRKRIEDQLAELVPSRITRSYDYKLNLAENYTLGSIIFKPGDDKLLSLTATARVAVKGTGADASLAVDASLTPFQIELKDYLTLHFKKFTFTAGTGRSPHFDAPFDKVVPSGQLVFLAALAAYLGYKSGGSTGAKANGPYVEPRLAGAGLRAGFRLAVPSMSIGTIGFANIAFDGHVELPFDGKEGVARIALSSRNAPFVISAAPYGGGGFVYLEADANRIRRTDISLEFGGAAVISYGPLEGVGRIMTGLYVTQAGSQNPQLFGTFTAGFNGSIAGFGIASAFYLRMTYEGGAMAGQAILEYSFDLGITDITFRVEVWRSEGSSLGSSPSDQSRENVSWRGATPRVMLASTGAVRSGAGITEVPSQLEDWSKHRSLYDTSLRLPRRNAT
ncbi:hypothetical protein [Sabulicella glaciei]|uniref:Uncharacterized protein n=1 Tax=Sabulicella glaciei TaxID=2984948 RepID=A0ABT3NZU2_9PROT|nr:hypothetical protein [Roseococcus sp. MDT2-1-1]MCW8087681.1 hypothetical protein [Roseococcus sp. MDT2-1-1]